MTTESKSEIDLENSLSTARELIEKGDNDEARTILLNVLKNDPDNQPALLMLGGEYFTAAKLPEAEMIFERLIMLAPGKGQFSIALFNTLWNAGRSEEALEEIKRFMEHANQEDEIDTILQYSKITQQLETSDE